MEGEKENYEELEGKEILYIWSGDTSFKCKVSAIDFDIGLSIQDIESGNYKVCLNGPSSPVKDQYREGEYEALFHKAVEQIKEGKVYASDLAKLLYDKPLFYQDTRVSPNTCAFSQ